MLANDRGKEMKLAGIKQIYIDVLKHGYRVCMVKARPEIIEHFRKMNMFVIETKKPRGRKSQTRCLLQPEKSGYENNK